MIELSSLLFLRMFLLSQYPIVVALYLLGAMSQAGASLARHKLLAKLSYGFGAAAIMIHGLLLYLWIDVGSGQNLTDLNLLSLAIWLTAIFVWIISLLRRPVSYLNILLYPLAALSIWLATRFNNMHILQTAADFKQFFHITLSIVTFSVLFLAGLQAIMLAAQERFLKQKHLGGSLVLPPLETMEKTLFETIAVGLGLLTLLLITSIVFFHTAMLGPFLQKTILTFIAWMIFSALLVGRHYHGWRGRKAIYCTLGGLTILSFIYFSSIIIMEFIS